MQRHQSISRPRPDGGLPHVANPFPFDTMPVPRQPVVPSLVRGR